MNGVFVVSSTRVPLMPTSPARARKLLGSGKAAVLRRFPFTIVLKNRETGSTQPLRLKLDPGSKETGIALVNEVTAKVVFAAVLTHRGQAIKARLDSRRAIRRSRRNRNTRYRAPRFDNRTRPKGWLPPSLQHRVETTSTWVDRIRRFSPVIAISQELVKFDLQKMENPEIGGIEYQQGTLTGYEVREYILEKFGRRCCYCGAEHVPLQVEHIDPRAKGGTNRISNLCLACEPCNTKKGTQSIQDFLAKKPEVLKQILAQAKRPLKDAAAVNSTRWALFQKLTGTGLQVETGSGGRTKFNRSRQGYPKQHWIDAACVGETGELVQISASMQPLLVKATGHGCRQLCGTDRYGFPSRHRSKQKKHFGFQTGDVVVAVVPKGKHQGLHFGTVACRVTGSFDVKTASGKVGGINQKYCRKFHSADGYGYSFGSAFLPRLKSWASCGGLS